MSERRVCLGFQMSDLEHDLGPPLPEFPEAGPLSWLGPTDDNLDWLESLDWLRTDGLQ